MSSLETLRTDVRLAKNQLIKASKILLHTLQEQEIATSQEIQILNERISYLEEEIKADMQSIIEENPGRRRLEIALESLRQQLEIEKELFETEGLNADKVLDLNFRVQEIAEALQTLQNKNA